MVQVEESDITYLEIRKCITRDAKSGILDIVREGVESAQRHELNTLQDKR